MAVRNRFVKRSQFVTRSGFDRRSGTTGREARSSGRCLMHLLAGAMLCAGFSSPGAAQGSAGTANGTPATLPPDAHLLPLTFDESPDPAQQQFNYYDFMWRSFIALNWPNVPITTAMVNGRHVITGGFRGEPDTRASILDQTGNRVVGPGVWETYREPDEIFLPPEKWPDYPQWNTPRAFPDTVFIAAGGSPPLRWPTPLTAYATDIFQPYFFPASTGPLVDQNGNYVRYEVAVNQAFFTYVRHFEYFNAARQIADVTRSVADPSAADGFQRPPFGFAREFAPGGYLSALPPFARQGMVDVKAAWRVLDPARGDRPERYLHRDIFIDKNGTVQLMGLVALHILRYTPNGEGAFVAATFEHVDNTSIEPQFRNVPGLKPSFNTGRPPSEIQKRLGFEGPIPPLEQRVDPAPVDIYRVTPLPVGDLSVSAANARYQQMLARSVFRFYRLIGTQNKRPENIIAGADPNLNGHEGPVTGVYTNTSNLINAALESYSQANFSCILCHVRARPQGVPLAAEQIDHFKILTFLLQSAKPPK